VGIGCALGLTFGAHTVVGTRPAVSETRALPKFRLYRGRRRSCRFRGDRRLSTRHGFEQIHNMAVAGASSLNVRNVSGEYRVISVSRMSTLSAGSIAGRKVMVNLSGTAKARAEDVSGGRLPVTASGERQQAGHKIESDPARLQHIVSGRELAIACARRVDLPYGRILRKITIRIFPSRNVFCGFHLGSEDRVAHEMPQFSESSLSHTAMLPGGQSDCSPPLSAK
jgi:hypothetical protein